MSLLTDFNKCIRNDWITSPKGVQYAFDGETLYFQCSRDTKDWLYNLAIPVSAYKNGSSVFLMHMGFNTLWHDVRDDIAKLPYIRIRGYSQGGVFASMAHEDKLYKTGFSCDTVVFGCPKFLFLPSDTIQDRFSDVVRMQNKDDLIAKSPPLYSHIGEPLILPKKGERPEGMKLVDYLSGHSPYQYRTNLEDL